MPENDNNWDIEAAFLKEGNGFKSAEVGHHVIAEDDVPTAIKEGFLHVVPCLHSLEDRFKPSFPQLVDKEKSVIFGVFNDEDVKGNWGGIIDIVFITSRNTPYVYLI